MADLFTPRVWADGSANGELALVTADRGPNRWEAGLGAIGDAFDELADQVAALVGAAENLTPGRVRTGTSDQRGAPGKGALFWDETLDRLIVGNGVRWEGSDGNELAGDGGGTTVAPTTLDAVQTGPGAATLTWTAAAGADHCELRESQSPTGVAGKTALTGTSTSLSGLPNRVHEWWLVAVDAEGNVSADSNHVLVDITSGTGAAATPWGILGLGPAGGGYWDVGIGLPTGHVNYPYSQLAAGFTSTPYFIPTADGTGVQFRVTMNGGLTSSAAGGPRSELREYADANGTKAAWVAASGTHTLEYTFRQDHVQPIRPYSIVGQLHDASNDVISIRIRGTSASALNVEAWVYGSKAATLVTGYVAGTAVKVKMELAAGVLRIWANDVLKLTDSTSFKNKTAAEMYWKVGGYADSSVSKSGESPSEYLLVRIIGPIKLSHSTTSTGGSEVVQEKAFQLTSTAENSTVAWWENYDYCADIKDGRGYTGGPVGFTSATGDMLELVQDYAARKPTGNALAPYLPNLQRCADFGDTVDTAVYGVNGGAASTKAASELGAAFITAWKNAANSDPLFRQCQRDYRNRVYWLPAYNAAVADGLGQLGTCLYYDTSINHGPGVANSNDGSFDDIRSRTTGTKPSNGGSESTWINNFLNVRSAVLTAWGDNPSDGRISMFRGLRTAGKFTLAPPVTWSVYGDTFGWTVDPTPQSDGAAGGTPGGGDTSSTDGTEAAKALGWGAVVEGDEFAGTSLSAKWHPYDGPGHDGNGRRVPSAFTVANGIMTCTGLANGDTGGMSFANWSGKRFRAEWRCRIYSTGTSGHPYHAVLIMWPQNDNRPSGGEDDFLETDVDSGKAEAFIHVPDGVGDNQEYASKPLDITQWHNYAVERTSTYVRGFIDGVEWFKYSGSYIIVPGAMEPTFQLDNFFGSSGMRPAKFEAMWFRIYAPPS